MTRCAACSRALLLVGRKIFERRLQFCARQFHRGGIRQRQAVELARVFQHGGVAAFLHVGQDGGDGRFQFFVGGLFEGQQLAQPGIEVGLLGSKVA